MAENIPNPSPGTPPVPPTPPKKAETGKVQPKKETVRISLPPKPTSAPTIKLPTLPAGGPPSATPATRPAGAPGSAPAPSAAPGARLSTSTGAPTAARPPTAAGAPGARPAPAAAPAAARAPVAPAPVVRQVSGLDLGLAIAAAVLGLGAVVSMVLLLQLK